MILREGNLCHSFLEDDINIEKIVKILTCYYLKFCVISMNSYSSTTTITTTITTTTNDYDNMIGWCFLESQHEGCN